MRLTVLLADSAQVDGRGKIHALGIGWTHVPFPTPPIAILLLIDWEPDETPSEFAIRIGIRSEGGDPILADGGQPFAITANGHADRLEGTNHNDVNRVPFAVQLGAGLPIVPGRYVLHTAVEAGSGFSATAEERFRVRQPGETA